MSKKLNFTIVVTLVLAMLLAACQPQTVEVVKTVEVEKEVEVVKTVEVEVEKLVEVTALGEYVGLSRVSPYEAHGLIKQSPGFSGIFLSRPQKIRQVLAEYPVFWRKKEINKGPRGPLIAPVC